jgi:hypothetical protein
MIKAPVLLYIHNLKSRSLREPRKELKEGQEDQGEMKELGRTPPSF